MCSVRRNRVYVNNVHGINKNMSRPLKFHASLSFLSSSGPVRSDLVSRFVVRTNQNPAHFTGSLLSLLVPLWMNVETNIVHIVPGAAVISQEFCLPLLASIPFTTYSAHNLSDQNRNSFSKRIWRDNNKIELLKEIAMKMWEFRL